MNDVLLCNLGRIWRFYKLNSKYEKNLALTFSQTMVWKNYIIVYLEAFESQVSLYT